MAFFISDYQRFTLVFCSCFDFGTFLEPPLGNNQNKVIMKKKLLGLSLLLLLMSSCDVVYVEEPIDARNLFTGRFEVEEYSETLDQTTIYNMRVSKENNVYSNLIFLENFYAADIDVFAEVYGDEIKIPRQKTNGYIIQGVGHLEYGDIVMTYSVEDLYSNGFVDFCNTVAYRR